MNKKSLNISPADTKQRTEVPEDLAYRILMAKLGMIGIVIGVLIGSYQLSFTQALLAAVVSAFGFIIPAWIVTLGQKTGLSTLIMSQATLGRYGNRVAKILAWINAFGWTILQVIISCWLLLTIITQGQVTKNTWALATSGIITLTLIGLLIWRGKRWNHDIRVWLHGLFVILSLVVAGFGFSNINWQAISNVPTANWFTNWVPAVMLATVATSLISTMAAGNWGNRIKKGHYQNSTLVAALIGGGLPSYLLIVVGLLLSYGIPSLANKRLPFVEIYQILPGWLNNIYFGVAVIILALHAMQSFKNANRLVAPLITQLKISSGQVQIGQFLAIALCTSVLVTSPVNFFEQLHVWLSTIGIILFGWFGTFTADYLLRHRQGFDSDEIAMTSQQYYHWEGILAWLLAVLVGMLTTNNALWQGPWAHGLFMNDGNGVLLAGVIGFGMIFVFKIIPLKQ
ncbi:cytosine permease [Periweissella fabalis]|uniref:Allantoin permease n=1 Tax=Periweissella fabalis TaxID=1070421 RepID=A0A7X6S2M6_9LACO|nr:cytosine permease [Periweissella fabalis]MCM0599409.1 cytosine permease [Periweissella fabalis]NKZ23688.1 hypothetical protein [Periweissella fabalis]